MIIIPFMPWIISPANSSNGASPPSNASSNVCLSRTPPSSTQMPRPAMPQTITAAWTITSRAMRNARTL